MSFDSVSIHLVEGSPQNGWCQYLYPQVSSGYLLPLQETLKRSADRSGLGSPQTTGSVLGPTQCETVSLYALYEWNPHVPQSSESPKISPSDFHTYVLYKCTNKAIRFGGSTSCSSTARLGSPVWDSDSLLFGKNLCICNYSPICGSLSWRNVSGIYTVSLPLLPVLLCFLLYILTCGISFLVDSGLFHQCLFNKQLSLW